jgi:mRNA interferase RelE/StbE
MRWSVAFLAEAQKDLKRLDHNAQIQVLKGIQKVAQNPVSVHEGGYGKPLGNRNGTDLAGLFKIKYRDLGLRVVYRLEYDGEVMRIIVISARTDEQVYEEAARRRKKYKL